MESFFSDYAPHGYCLLWDPALVWTHVGSDLLIAASYFSIPLALFTFVRRRPDIAFGRVAGLFALFILSCGVTHVLGIWNLWHGDYGVEALAKLVTAIASVPTAVTLWRLLPQALALPSPAMLQERNDALAAALAERDSALAQLRAEVEQRERAEAALVQSKKIEAVGQLTGGIAHDFNNLLQGIKGYVELIGMMPERPDQVRDWAASAADAVERGTRLTSQLLTFSRQQRLQAEEMCVASLIGGMEEFIRNAVGPRIAVDVRVGDDLGLVKSDRNQLELALLNLAINARDAMPEGGRLSVAADRRGDQVAISVTDTGIGMADEVAERAFEPFFTTKEPGRGTGLGLSTVYGVAQQAGGGVTITSAPGAGTTVVVTLPRQAAAAAAPPAPHLVLVADRPTSALGSILLVDDDDHVRPALADLLAARGYRVEQARSGVEALALLAQRPFDLLLLDYAMPGLTGADIAARARARRPGQRVIFLTGHADSEAIEKATAGDARVLKKPIGAADLVAAVAEALSAPRTRSAPRPATALPSAR